MFDNLAERNQIFKVETVGDCYVAGKKISEFCFNYHIYLSHSHVLTFESLRLASTTKETCCADVEICRADDSKNVVNGYKPGVCSWTGYSQSNDSYWGEFILSFRK